MTEWITTHPRARKEHVCSNCRRTIRPGETYRRGVALDGTAWTWKDCRHCEFALDQYDLAWDGEYSPDTFHEWVGDGTSDLAELRLQAGFRKQWTTAKGNPWPLPTDRENRSPESP